MTEQQAKPAKALMLAGLCGLVLWGGSAAAHGYDDDRYPRHDRFDRYERAEHLYRKGDRIERRLDRKGDRIEARLRHEAAHLRAEGRYAEARRLERKGMKINRHLDRKGERIHDKLHRKADRLSYRERSGWHRGDHHDYRPYRPREVHVHGGRVAFAIELSR